MQMTESQHRKTTEQARNMVNNGQCFFPTEQIVKQAFFPGMFMVVVAEVVAEGTEGA